jgi:hypothetical protein
MTERFVGLSLEEVDGDEQRRRTTCLRRRFLAGDPNFAPSFAEKATGKSRFEKTPPVTAGIAKNLLSQWPLPKRRSLTGGSNGTIRVSRFLIRFQGPAGGAFAATGHAAAIKVMSDGPLEPALTRSPIFFAKRRTLKSPWRSIRGRL